MGQRLVCTVQLEGQDICKLYFHWSAYTISALCEAQKIVNCIYNHDDETKEELQLRLIRFCYDNGGGIDGNDYEFDYIQNLYPGEEFRRDGYSRNCGLIAISEKGMEELQGWSEGDITINIDEDEIYNGVYSYYENLTEYNEARAEWDDEPFNGIPLKKVPDIGYDLSEIAIEDIQDVIDALTDVDGYVVRNGNEIFELIA